MKCDKCGAELREGLKFCPGCGAKTPAESALGDSGVKRPSLKIQDNWKLFILIVGGAVAFYFLSAGYLAFSAHRGLKLAEQRLRTGQYKACESEAAKLTRRRPKNLQPWMLLAECRSALDDSDGALEAVDKAIKWHKNSAPLHSMRGEIQYFKNDYQESEKSLLNALEIDENDRRANQHMGLIRLHDKKHKDAVSYLGKALKGAGRKDSIRLNHALGEAYFAMSDFENAEKCFLAALAHDLNRSDISIRLIETYLALNKFKDAKKEVERISVFTDETPYLASLRARVYALAEKVETIEYIMKRKDCDQNFMIVYTEMQGFINRLNSRAGSFMGKQIPELTEMTENSKKVYDCYQSLSPKSEYYYLVHTKCLSTASLLGETAASLDGYVRSGNENPDVQGIAEQLRSFEKRSQELFDVWAKEQREMRIDELIEQGKKIESGEIKAADLILDLGLPAEPETKEPEKIDSE
jgi:tetratricopeptide (TPR) repeat protein